MGRTPTLATETPLAPDAGDTLVVPAAAAWAASADISARSTLATILGDTVVPLGGEFWLSELFRLTEPFGFSDRLVRTSMSRLATEGWVETRRQGRRSRYSLSDYARQESLAAEKRIYRRSASPATEPGAQWLLVFSVDPQLATHLRWRGFAETSPGVLGRPETQPSDAEEVFRELGMEEPPMAVAQFVDATKLSSSTHFRATSGLEVVEAKYADFVDRYGALAAEASMSGPEAFAFRTMLVHDLRRCRLAQPDIPTAALPQDWIGNRAHALAADRYHQLSPTAWSWVAEVTGNGDGSRVDEHRFDEPQSALNPMEQP